METNNKPYQQGDVLIYPIYNHGLINIDDYDEIPKEAKLLNHLVLAHGENGHEHKIVSGEAALYNMQGLLFLRVFSDKALLRHGEHGEIVIPKGDHIVRKIFEYDHFLEEKREAQD